MKNRNLGPFEVSAIGLGCMGLSYGYMPAPDRSSAARVLQAALDLGYTHFDTATMYGGGANEELIGEVLWHRRGEFVLASKCGLYPGKGGRPRDVDGRPERIKRACDDSLRRLKTDVIDIYYLHRLDHRVPIEDSVGALADLVQAGKIKSIGLSEMSASTVRRAHAVHRIAALQTEYSLWTRNAEIAVLDVCRELGISFVAFSPLGRGFLTGKLTSGRVEGLDQRDLRRQMPRFAPTAYRENVRFLSVIDDAATELDCSPAELALAWVLSRGEHVVAIPGTTKLDHLAENVGGAGIVLGSALTERLDKEINERTVVGGRYSESQQADIDTEEFMLAS